MAKKLHNGTSLNNTNTRNNPTETRKIMYFVSDIKYKITRKLMQQGVSPSRRFIERIVCKNKFLFEM